MRKAALAITTVVWANLIQAATPMLSQADLVKGGEGGYLAYRAPSLVTSSKRTVIAIFEGRKNSLSDSGDINTLAMRSFDSGKTWSSFQVIAENGTEKIGNPCTLIDRQTHTIWVILLAYLARLSQKQIIAGEGSIHVWAVRSVDDGAHWSAPFEITNHIQGHEERQTWFSTGPGIGVQLRSGRLVVPVYYRWKGSNTSYAAVIYSDDHGSHWILSKPAGELTNEGQVAELADGSLVYNMRSYAGRNRRAVSRSTDSGQTWTSPELDNALIEPVCQGAFVRFTDKGGGHRDWLLFSNPADTKRQNMAVRLSRDGGRSWSDARPLYEGPAAYSSLAVLPDGKIGCLYERGDRGPYEKLTFARFDLAWLIGR
jgi:sialidase-1